ncbi:ribonuclease H family protein [Mycolicibacterium sp.]|uniref:ribonuclease H family protein n=1 Tax=Mycolicibacterium sp. TaxID=2320850 RepID=UPI0025E1E846|nr:ribonuclease H family protein [Mycolicibacterium sp.]
MYLDNNGVYYSSVSGVIDAGKMTCRILRSGGGVPAAMGFLGRAGYHHRRRCRRYVPGHAARDRCLPEPDCGRQRRAGMTVDHLDSRCESETPRPRPRPRRVDLGFAQPRPVESIVIDVAESHLGYCYAAVSAQRSWSGVVAAPNVEAAVLNAIDEICAGRPERQRIRFIPCVGSGSPLWHYAAQIFTATTDWWIERPTREDRALVASAAEQLERARLSLPPLPVDRGPITVATDGSIRCRHAGFAWLASSGEHGVAAFAVSSKRVGTNPVLVAELCAIGSAVCGLPRHRLTVLSDSRSAVAMVNRWKRGDFVLPAEYPVVEPTSDRSLIAMRRRIHAERGRITLRWVPGHCGEPLNEGADALARLASRYRRGDRDLNDDEYSRRAAGIAKGFAAAYRRADQSGKP